MMENRRSFLAVLASVGAPVMLFARRISAQLPAPTPASGQNPRPPENPDARDSEAPMPKSGAKAILEANEKDIKKNVEKLYALASELKTEVEKTDSVQVLSLGLVKKAEEIEKLAHEIKTRARG